MDNRNHIHHSTRRIAVSYPVSLWQRLHSAFTPLILIVGLFIIFEAASVFPISSSSTITPGEIGLAFLATFIRLLIAYVAALAVSIPLALLVEWNAFAERILLPLFDVAQSVPVLAFFPLIILVFVHSGFLEGAAMFVIFHHDGVDACLQSRWRIEGDPPTDIKDAASQVFNLTGFSYSEKDFSSGHRAVSRDGSLLTWAQGWNIIIVAEVLHTYIPGGTAAQDLFGIGNVLVKAAASGQNGTFAIAILVMIAAIALINFFVWQKLLHYAERYKFE